MTTIHIKVKVPLVEGHKLPVFATASEDNGYFWLVTDKCQGTRGQQGYYKATFLGNSDYHPFQYHGEIRLKDYKLVEKARVVLQFD